MRHPLTPIALPILAMITTLAPLGSAQTTVDLVSSQDNTLYESLSGTISNGAGSRFFSGVSGLGNLQRGLVQFDVAATVPAGAIITSANLHLRIVQTSVSSAKNISLHPVTQAWGEGTTVGTQGQGGGGAATVGSATWLHTFFNTSFWNSAGGDFNSTASATSAVGGLGPVTWTSTAGLVNDIQDWLDNPSTNYGWLLLSPEDFGSKVFASRESTNASFRPRLEVTYVEPFVSYGSGCPGSGGFVPSLQGSGDTSPGGAISLTIDQGVGGSSALLFLGLMEATIPVGFGCTLNVSPLIGAPVSLPLLGSGAGNGTFTLPVNIPVTATTGAVTIQAFCIDGGVPLGASGTNGLRLTIP